MNLINPDALLEAYVTPLAPLSTPLRPRGRLTGPVKAILFDVYGTLFISGSGDITVSRNGIGHPESLARLLEKFGVPQEPGPLVAAFFNMIQKTHQGLREKGIDFPEVNIDAVWSDVLGMSHMPTVRQFAIEFELLVNPVYPMPNLQRLLSFCKASALPMGIISNAQFFTPLLFDWFLESDLTGLGFSEDLLVFSYRHDTAKPSRRLFELAARALAKRNVLPASVLYIGNDMRNDMVPAARAGFQTALFAGDSRSLRLRENDPVCRELTPDLVVTDLIQIVNHLGTMKT